MRNGVFIVGLRIESNPSGPSNPAHVTVRELGSGRCTYLTPEEARQVADVIADAANMTDDGMTKNVIVAGLRIESHRARLDEPAYVMAHKLGSEMRAFMTPTEARGMVGALVAAAVDVEDEISLATPDAMPDAASRPPVRIPEAFLRRYFELLDKKLSPHRLTTSEIGELQALEAELRRLSSFCAGDASARP